MDSFSDDATTLIVSSFPAVRFIQRRFDNHANQWNFGVDNIETEWVLSLDADYCLTKTLLMSCTSCRNKKPSVKTALCHLKAQPRRKFEKNEGRLPPAILAHPAHGPDGARGLGNRLPAQQQGLHGRVRRLAAHRRQRPGFPARGGEHPAGVRRGPARLPLTDEIFSLPPVRISRREAFSFALARKLLAHYEATPLHMDMRAVLDKIAESLEGDISIEPDWLSEQVGVLPEDRVRIDPEVWAQVAGHIERREAMRADYQSFAGRASRYGLHPLHLLANRKRHANRLLTYF